MAVHGGAAATSATSVWLRSLAGSESHGTWLRLSEGPMPVLCEQVPWYLAARGGLTIR